MKFVDEVRVVVRSGDGGKGAVAFRRAKYVEHGGPSGGDGGNGGSVIFVADLGLTTLLDYRYQPLHRAKHGEHGMGSDRNGAASPDLVLKLPVGTLIKDADTGEVLCDLAEPGQQFVAARGGGGGRGKNKLPPPAAPDPKLTHTPKTRR